MRRSLSEMSALSMRLGSVHAVEQISLSLYRRAVNFGVPRDMMVVQTRVFPANRALFCGLTLVALMLMRVCMFRFRHVRHHLSALGRRHVDLNRTAFYT